MQHYALAMGSVPTSVRRPGRRRDVLLVALLALVIGALGVRAVRLFDPVGSPSAVRWAFQDFRDAVYYPVVAWQAGDNPYDVESYRAHYPVDDLFPLFTPTELLLHRPLGLLSYRSAAWAYFALNVVLIVVLASASLRIAGRRPALGSVCGVAALILLTRPGHWNLLLGQPTMAIILGVLMALCWARERPLLAGIGLTLAFMKPNFGAPLAALMLVQGGAVAVLVGGGLTVLIALPVGAQLARAAGGLGPFVDSLRDNASHFHAGHGVDPLTSPFRIDIPALIARVSGDVPGTAVDLTVGAIVLLIGAVALRRLATAIPERRVVPLGVGTLTLLVATYHMTYDLLLLAPVVVALALGGDDLLWRAGPTRRRMLLVGLVLAAFNYLSTESVLDGLRVSPSVRLAATTFTPAVLALAWGTFAALALPSGPRSFDGHDLVRRQRPEPRGT